MPLSEGVRKPRPARRARRGRGRRVEARRRTVAADAPTSDLRVRPRLDRRAAEVGLLEHLGLEAGGARAGRQRRGRHGNVGPQVRRARLEHDARLRELLPDARRARSSSARASRCSCRAARGALSASGPTTAIRAGAFANGSTPSFFSSTIDSRASFSASSRCAGLSSSESGTCAAFTWSGGSKSPSSKRSAQHPLQGDVDLRLGQQALLHRVDVALVVGRPRPASKSTLVVQSLSSPALIAKAPASAADFAYLWPVSMSRTASQSPVT